MRRRRAKAQKAQGQAPGAKTARAEAAPVPSQYFFSFEMIRQYPTIRSFIVKGQLKKSFGDTVSELFGGSKKGVYKF